MPSLLPPENIQNDINLIKEAEFRTLDCDDIINLNKRLKTSLMNYPKDYGEFLSHKFGDFEKIIMSKGTCKDALKNRNYNIAANFLSIARENPESIFYGELGMAHTILKNKVAASIINSSAEFKGKVCVINLYCYNCSNEK